MDNIKSTDPAGNMAKHYTSLVLYQKSNDILQFLAQSLELQSQFQKTLETVVITDVKQHLTYPGNVT